jgi:hypothetical protein
MEPLTIAAVVLIVLSFVPPLILLGVILYQTFRGYESPWKQPSADPAGAAAGHRPSGTWAAGGMGHSTIGRFFSGPSDRSADHSRISGRLHHRDAIRQMVSAASGTHPDASGSNPYSTFIRPVQHLGWRSTHISRGFSRIPLLVYDRFGNCHTEHRLLCMN